MLFRLNIVRAAVEEVPMPAHYGDERSSLKISIVLMEFPGKYLNRFVKRIFYNYFLRDFNVCSIELITGLLLLVWAVLFGGYHWYLGFRYGVYASSGTVMLAAMPFILGFQLLIAAASFDVGNVPKRPLSRISRDERK